MTHAPDAPDIRDAHIDELVEFTLLLDADALSPDDLYAYLRARLDALYPPTYVTYRITWATGASTPSRRRTYPASSWATRTGRRRLRSLLRY